jgi:hypothetical protein
MVRDRNLPVLALLENILKTQFLSFSRGLEICSSWTVTDPKVTYACFGGLEFWAALLVDFHCIVFDVLGRFSRYAGVFLNRWSKSVDDNLVV